MKKIRNIFYIVLAVLGALWLFAQITLRLILPLGPVQEMLLERLSKVTGRPVYAERISMRLSGLRLHNVQIASSENPSQEADLLRAKTIFFHWSLWNLLHGHVKIISASIEGLEVNVVRYADGKFNFDGLFGAGQTPEPKEENASVPFNISIQDFRLNHAHFTFTDLQQNQKAEASDVFFELSHFRFDEVFPVSINADLFYSAAGLTPQTAEVGLTIWPNLQNLDFSKMSVEIKRAVLKHKGGTFVLTGYVENPLSPVVQVQVTARDLSQELVSFIVPDVPEFSVPKFSVNLSAAADLQKDRVEVSSLMVKALASEISACGTVNKISPLVFSAQTDFNVNLSVIGEALPMLQTYRLQGIVLGQASGTEQSAQAEINLQNIGAQLPRVGSLSNFNMQVAVPDLEHLYIEKFAGDLNEGNFDGSLSVRRTSEKVFADVNFHSARLALPPAKENSEPSSLPSERLARGATWNLPLFNVTAKVDVDSLDAPYIYGQNIHFTANLQDLSPALSRVQGELSLNVGNGEIRDLNKLTNANILTKVMFGSLGAVSKVINSLNVFAVLNGIGSGMVDMVSAKEEKPADMVVQTIKNEEGEEVQILVPYSDKRIDGALPFELFSSDIAFKDGIADVKKGAFVSDMMSFNLTGDMNFQTQGLDLTVNAAPGRHYEGGIMPLTLNVGGTMDNPQGSMSVTSSLTSMLTQGVGNNFASRSVKKGIGGFFGLFKKKKPAPAEVAAPNAVTASHEADKAAAGAEAQQSKNFAE